VKVPSTTGTVRLDLATGQKEFIPSGETSITSLTEDTVDTAQGVLSWRAIDRQGLRRYMLVLALAHRAVRTGATRTVRDVFYEYKVI
jgi:DNA topoisomerase VI subunit A